MADLSGRTALVTGASRGIGRAVAERLAADGALVAVHYGGDDAAAADTVSAIERAGGKAFAIRAELGVDGDVDTLFAAFGDRCAGLDILVNNASSGPAGPIEETTPEAFDRIFAVNVKAPFFILQRALPLLRDGGRVITVSSVSTRIATPVQTSYVMTKAAVEVMGRTLANALGARQITVNTVTPGATDTDMNKELFEVPGVTAYLAGQTALDRIGRPADIAAAVAFLASDDARWITGHVLDASGGMYLGPRL
ncbi:SDR family oxidoreductase [Nonomuraea sp. LPB2021202275-12-8]|uniref:SDR family oxidoreductase n=1 Tax=Nonomuraea sp. LPB2021202275-12-8 TaxID=3120159 RepID=UPI00300D4B31